jgi:hypothetical protein
MTAALVPNSKVNGTSTPRVVTERSTSGEGWGVGVPVIVTSLIARCRYRLLIDPHRNGENAAGGDAIFAGRHDDCREN